MKLPWKLLLSVVFSSGFLLMASALAADTNRGVRIQLRASEEPTAPVVEEVQLYGASHALVIGINDYTQGWPRLSNAIRDAELVAAELRKKGFEVTLKLDLSSADLKSAFEEFFVYKGEDPQARLFVWFAGHGHTENGEGYLIPADSPLPDAGAEFRIKALSMRRFGEFVRLAGAKHALAVFDSCFSGTIFTTQRSAPPAAVTRATALPVRQFLSSGDENQQVSDDGRFRKLFIRALRGEERADANGDSYLTGSELGMFLTDRVTNLTENRQTPRYGKLRDEDYDRGDFVFLLPSPPAVAPKPRKTETYAILSVDSNVIGARVLVDGREVGTTDLADTEIPPGEHRIMVEKQGYEPYSKKVSFVKGRAVTLYVDLRRQGPSKAKLYVDTEPEDARIRILNIKPKYSRGIALDPGRYHVEVAAKGYETERRWIDLAAGHEAPIRFDLAKRRPAIQPEPTRVESAKAKAAKPPASAGVKPARTTAAESAPALPTMTNSIGMKFVRIPAGNFEMGSNYSPKDVAAKFGGQAEWHQKEHPRHVVEISKPFYLQTTEVTQGQWKRVMVQNPSYFKDCGDDCPVEMVSWNMARQFISKLNHMERTTKYRLPTEAEWEYAGRAATNSPFYTGQCISTDQANYSGNSPGANCPAGERSRETVKVGSYQSNAWGLFDMHGNVWEWCQDRYGNYSSGPVVDPVGPSEGRARLARGGSFNTGALHLRSAFRREYRPSFRFQDTGFRVVRDF